MRKKYALLTVMITALLYLFGCVPKDLKNMYEALPADIEAAEKIVVEKKAAYENVKKAKEWKEFFQLYAEREKWDAKFSESEAEIKHARNGFEQKVTPIFKKYRSSDNSKFAQAMGAVKGSIRAAINSSSEPAKRMAALKEARDKTPEMVSGSERSYLLLKEAYLLLEGEVQKAQKDYPDKNDDLNKRLSPARNLYLEVEKANKTVLSQSKAEIPDYAVIYDNYVIVTKTNPEKFGAMDKDLRTKISELNRSYSKVLIDMRQDLFIEIGRTSWDEDSDWPTEHSYVYSLRKTSEPSYEYFGGLPETQTLASYAKGWGTNSRPYIDQGEWNKLNISWEESWPSSWDDHAEYWLSDLPIKCYHKYTIVENGKKTETDWVEVDEEDYEDYEDDLGMEIVSKPYGYYESEKLEQSNPAGLSKVGNKNYGEWKKDPSSGDSYWEWYGKYRFYTTIFGLDRPYYYSEWDTWNRGYRGRDSYYGPKSDPKRYGTYGHKTRSRYAGSHFSKNGGYKSQDVSARSAGASSRGRGPGGGGK